MGHMCYEYIAINSFGFSLIPRHTCDDMDLHALRGVVDLTGRKGMHLGVAIGLTFATGSILG